MATRLMNIVSYHMNREKREAGRIIAFIWSNCVISSIWRNCISCEYNIIAIDMLMALYNSYVCGPVKYDGIDAVNH